MAVVNFFDTGSIDRSLGEHNRHGASIDADQSGPKFSVDTNQLPSHKSRNSKHRKSLSLQSSVILDLKVPYVNRRDSNIGAHPKIQVKDSIGTPESKRWAPIESISSKTGKQGIFKPIASSFTGLGNRQAADSSQSIPDAVVRSPLTESRIGYTLQNTVTIGDERGIDHIGSRAHNKIKCFQKLSSGSTNKNLGRFTQQDSLCPMGPPQHSATITSRFGLNEGRRGLQTLSSQMSSYLHPQMSGVGDDGISRADTGFFRLRTKSLLQVQALGAELGETIELDQQHQGQGSEESARESSKKRSQPKLDSAQPVLRLDTQIDLGYELTQSKYFTDYLQQRELQMKAAAIRATDKRLSGTKYLGSKSIIRETTAEDETLRASEKFPSYEAYPTIGKKMSLFSGLSNQQPQTLSESCQFNSKPSYHPLEPISVPQSLELRHTMTSLSRQLKRRQRSEPPRPKIKIASHICLKTLRRHLAKPRKFTGISIVMGPAL